MTHKIFPKPSRVAIIHYWLVGMRGGERVLENLLDMFPNADIFTHVYDEYKISEKINKAKIQQTFIAKLPGSRKYYQKYLPLMPMALEELDLRGYDLIISSESGPAKGVITDPGSLHICYCHSPMRYIWDHYKYYKYSAGMISRLMMPMIFHRLRQWDVSSASRVDGVVANSTFIANRVRKTWGRDSRVVYPPVAVAEFSPVVEVGDRYLWISQMTPYKRADLALEVFNRLGVPALMVGDGEMFDHISANAAPNVKVHRRLSFQDLKRVYSSCKALVFTAEEDFGIVPVEANASGRPVLAYGRGGVTDSIVEGKTGLFFMEQTADSLAAGIRRMEDWLPHFRPEDAVVNAARFSPEEFRRGINDALNYYYNLALYRP